MKRSWVTLARTVLVGWGLKPDRGEIRDRIAARKGQAAREGILRLEKTWPCSNDNEEELAERTVGRVNSLRKWKGM